MFKLDLVGFPPLSTKVLATIVNPSVMKLKKKRVAEGGGGGGATVLILGRHSLKVDRSETCDTHTQIQAHSHTHNYELCI